MLVREMTIKYKKRGKVGVKLDSPKAVAAAVRKLIGDDPREHFMVIHVDTRLQIIDVEVISIGSVSASLVHPREVFRAAISRSATGIILAHNHPSGDPSPSKEDHVLTKRLREAGKILGIQVLDHIIVTSKGLYSFRGESTW